MKSSFPFGVVWGRTYVFSFVVENIRLGWACNFVMTSWDISFKYHMNNLSLRDEFLRHIYHLMCS